MTPQEFVARWTASTLTERAGAQSQFIDLCRLVDEPTPSEADPTGEEYAFERGANKATGTPGWADIWKKDHFAWEYKGKKKDLNAALAQLLQYAGALGNPPLLVVSDMLRFRIHTNWTNTVSTTYEIPLEGLLDPHNRQILKWVLSDPERLKPGLTRQALTEKAAAQFAALSQRLRERGHPPDEVAHFVNRLVFSMFAEDVDLLPNKMFQRMLEASVSRPEQFAGMASQLFGAMRSGGLVGFEAVEYFNGGLFNDDTALPLDKTDITQVLAASRLDWSDIDPSIFGTLFERGLDPNKRTQLGAHYTDRDKIALLVEPVIVRPLFAEWEIVKAKIAEQLAIADKARARRPEKQADARKVHQAARRTEEAATREARRLLDGYRESLRTFRVLDPACGSGNFLYMALLALKDLEHRANVEAEAMGLDRAAPAVGPECLFGIEVNEYAAELARITAWIGEIQWMKRNGFGVRKNPILLPLDNIAHRDAVLTDDGREAEWPVVDVIIGNPPFLGGKLLRTHLKDATVESLFRVYAGRVPAEADFVCYWFAKAWEAIAAGRLKRAGLVATNSIRGGANRKVLDRIAANGAIFDAWDDEPWVVDGAAVRVSLVCFGSAAEKLGVHMNGQSVSHINADLTDGLLDLTSVRALAENRSVAFMGDTKGGSFDIQGDLARAWLAAPLNPNGRPNADVLRPWLNGMDITRRSSGKWIVDFGWEMSVEQAMLYEAPFRHIETFVKPEREKNRRASYRIFWWRHAEPRQGMWRAIRKLKRFIATPEVSKHRVFVWLTHPTVPDHKLQIIAREDDTTFGILHSRFHKIWSVAVGSWHGVGNDPRYTISTCFETFPFPHGLTPNTDPAEYETKSHAIAIADQARRLDELRNNWLNPPDVVRSEAEVVAGFPDRLIPVDERAATVLKSRTLTNLYNERPTWLDDAHRRLDEAVAAAYGWPVDIGEDDALTRLLALNQARVSR